MLQHNRAHSFSLIQETQCSQRIRLTCTAVTMHGGTRTTTRLPSMWVCMQPVTVSDALDAHHACLMALQRQINIHASKVDSQSLCTCRLPSDRRYHRSSPAVSHCNSASETLSIVCNTLAAYPSTTMHARSLHPAMIQVQSRPDMF